MIRVQRITSSFFRSMINLCSQVERLSRVKCATRWSRQACEEHVRRLLLANHPSRVVRVVYLGPFPRSDSRYHLSRPKQLFACLRPYARFNSSANSSTRDAHALLRITLETESERSASLVLKSEHKSTLICDCHYR